MPPDSQKAIPKGGSTDTYDARITALEVGHESLMTKVDEIHEAVVGKVKEPGQGELIRQLQDRVAFLYGLLKWAAGLVGTALIGLWAAWLNSGRPSPH